MRHTLREMLRINVLTLGFFSLGARAAEEFGCEGMSGLEEYPSQIFTYQSGHGQAFKNSTLVSTLGGGSASSLANWLEVIYTEKGIQLSYRLPEVGLPLSVYNLRVEVLDRQGEPLLAQQLTENGECAHFSLFAGQKSRVFKVPEAPRESAAELRIRVRILGGEL